MHSKTNVFFFCILPSLALSFATVVGVTAMSKQGALTLVAASIIIVTSVACAMFLGFFFGRRTR